MTPAEFEPASLGSCGEYENHGITGVDFMGRKALSLNLNFRFLNQISLLHITSS